MRIRTDLADLERVVEAELACSDEEATARGGLLARHALRYDWSEIAKAMLERYREAVEHGR